MFKFSVIIPLYNKEPYVAKAIQSVLDQTFSDYELIIVDDGSMDGSYTIAAQSVKDHSNCRLMQQANAGVSVARNNGVAASHGDFLCFLDADDWWEPNFLEEMAGLVESFPDAGIYGANYTIVNETKRKTRVAKIGVEEGFEKGYINYCKVYASTMFMPLTSISVAISRSIFDEMHGFAKGIKLGEDFLLWIHVALKYKVAFLNKPLAYYNQDVDTASRGVGKLYYPSEHMLWNLTDLEPVEKSDGDYKHLVDCLRTNMLLPYFLSKDYHDAAKKELDKVDWVRQSETLAKQYRQPLAWLKVKYALKKKGAKLKSIWFAVLKRISSRHKT